MSDFNNLSFKNQPIYQTRTHGVVSVTKPASTYTQTETIAHGLGYAPLAHVFVETGDTSAVLPYIVEIGDTGDIGILVDFEVDKDNLYLNIKSTDAAGGSYGDELNYVFRYILYGQRGDND